MRFVDRVCSLDFMSILFFSLPFFVRSREKLDTRLCGFFLEFKKLHVSTFDIFVEFSGGIFGSLHLRYSQVFCPRDIKFPTS